MLFILFYSVIVQISALALGSELSHQVGNPVLHVALVDQAVCLVVSTAVNLLVCNQAHQAFLHGFTNKVIHLVAAATIADVENDDEFAPCEVLPVLLIKVLQDWFEDL